MAAVREQESAEAVVPRTGGERAEQQRFWELEGNARDTKKAEHFVGT